VTPLRPCPHRETIAGPLATIADVAAWAAALAAEECAAPLPVALPGVEAIKSWRRAAGEAGDLDLIATLDRLGDGWAAEMYEAARA